ncbi:ABC transporter ATP-binding protein [Telmatospirillum siberiense]|uniref:ABC transporter ATP-binding protein n=1 Tax=Telmatospirillum siberiense TaxID=382514 RepID=A0A2N3PNV0_9PROT|nr:ATP-binding cassette domain-containing protein [Telmatospirillum siberiense]PKU22076.1 ABC transporter ATP-binding protein [Telmatospirillum siberiense]
MPNRGLIITNIASGYGDGTVLSALSLICAPGERLGVIGRNGAGKTTLLRTILGLLPVRSGTLRYLEQDLTTVKTHEIARLGIAYVPQGRQLFPDFTVAQNLFLGTYAPLRQRHRIEGHLDIAYESFPWLYERRDDRAGGLSGGQQQQLAIARAMVSRPSLLLLDEPLEGIQPSIVEEISRVLKIYGTQAATSMLIIEQNLNILTELCDRILLIESGEIINEFNASQLKEDKSSAEYYMNI